MKRSKCESERVEVEILRVSINNEEIRERVSHSLTDVSSGEGGMGVFKRGVRETMAERKQVAGHQAIPHSIGIIPGAHAWDDYRHHEIINEIHSGIFYIISYIEVLEIGTGMCWTIHREGILCDREGIIHGVLRIYVERCRSKRR